MTDGRNSHSTDNATATATAKEAVAALSSSGQNLGVTIVTRDAPLVGDSSGYRLLDVSELVRLAQRLPCPSWHHREASRRRDWRAWRRKHNPLRSRTTSVERLLDLNCKHCPKPESVLRGKSSRRSSWTGALQDTMKDPISMIPKPIGSTQRGCPLPPHSRSRPAMQPSSWRAVHERTSACTSRRPSTASVATTPTAIASSATWTCRLTWAWRVPPTSGASSVRRPRRWLRRAWWLRAELGAALPDDKATVSCDGTW